ncbi:MAG: biotin--[acetyl-CoA-carboxylase] ligase [Nitrospirae bacterium]|nr:MAG: biotin--[acetyl-CoA-carboxylase] ligase [Nitrospirota bacterium]
MPEHGPSSSPDDLSAANIRAGLKSGFWDEILCYLSVSSSNDIALSLPEISGPRTASVIIAEQQEKGRGRLGRTWVSPPGLNICMSMALAPDIEPAHAAFLTISAALAAASALRQESGLAVLLKWPNDLVVADRKLGGILTEIRTEGRSIRKAAVGIGLNINSSSADLPAEIACLATSLFSETGRRFDRARIISEILKGFELRYNMVRAGNRGSLISELKGLSSSLGRQVKVMDNGLVTEGLAEDIDDEGLLIVRLASGLRKRIGNGDLTEGRLFNAALR